MSSYSCADCRNRGGGGGNEQIVGSSTPSSRRSLLTDNEGLRRYCSRDGRCKQRCIRYKCLRNIVDIQREREKRRRGEKCERIIDRYTALCNLLMLQPWHADISRVTSSAVSFPAVDIPCWWQDASQVWKQSSFYYYSSVATRQRMFVSNDMMMVYRRPIISWGCFDGDDCIFMVIIMHTARGWNSV